MITVAIATPGVAAYLLFSLYLKNNPAKSHPERLDTTEP